MLVEGKVIKRNSSMRLNGYGFLEVGRCFTSSDPSENYIENRRD